MFAATCEAESGSPLAGYRLFRSVAHIEAASPDCAWIMGNPEVIRARSRLVGSWRFSTCFCSTRVEMVPSAAATSLSVVAFLVTRPLSPDVFRWRGFDAEWPGGVRKDLPMCGSSVDLRRRMARIHHFISLPAERAPAPGPADPAGLPAAANPCARSDSSPP